jgi:hypothetical protein
MDSRRRCQLRSGHVSSRCAQRTSWSQRPASDLLARASRCASRRKVPSLLWLRCLRTPLVVRRHRLWSAVPRRRPALCRGVFGVPTRALIDWQNITVPAQYHCAARRLATQAQSARHSWPARRRPPPRRASRCARASSTCMRVRTSGSARATALCSAPSTSSCTATRRRKSIRPALAPRCWPVCPARRSTFTAGQRRLRGRSWRTRRQGRATHRAGRDADVAGAQRRDRDRVDAVCRRQRCVAHRTQRATHAGRRRQSHAVVERRRADHHTLRRRLPCRRARRPTTRSTCAPRWRC